MFMFDRWEELERQQDKYDVDTVRECRALSNEMCSKIFNVLGLEARNDGSALRVTGRGLTYLFPLWGTTVPMRRDDCGPRSLTPRQTIYRKKKMEKEKEKL